MNKQEKIKKGFDSISSSYTFLSKLLFGNSLSKLQTLFLSEFKNIPSLLILGGGNGELLLNMLQQNCFKKCVYVDISEKMIEDARSKVNKQFPGRIEDVSFVCCPAENFYSAEKFDAVFLPFLLDCLPAEAINKIIFQSKDRLKENGTIALSEFNIPPHSSWWLNIFAKCLMFTLYLFFNIICSIGIWKLPDFKKHFELNGFHIKKEKFLMKGVLVTQIYGL